MEAAACGRPVITTNSVGCRDAVRPGETGLLCEPNDVESLSSAIRDFVAAGAEVHHTMSQAARRLAEREFDEQIVLNRYRAALGLG